MATITDSMGQMIQQLFSPLADHYLPKTARTWKKVSMRSNKVAQMDKMGKDWTFIWPFMVGMAGAVQPSPIAGPDILTAPTTPAPPDFQLMQDMESWPGLTESPFPGLWQKQATLKRVKVDFYIPIQVRRLAQMKACVGDMMEGILRGTAKNLTHSMSNYFFAQTGNSLVSSIGSFTLAGGPTTIGASGTAVTLDIAGTSGEVPNSFAKWSPGMAVDLYPDNSNTRANPYPCFISTVKGINRTATYPGHFYIYSPLGSFALADDVYQITPRASGREAGTSYLPTPLESMIKSSGTVFNIDVAKYPWFQSITETGSVIPTESEFVKTLAELEQFGADFDDDMAPDTWLMTPGVMARYFQDYTAPGATLHLTDEGKPRTLGGGVKTDITYTLYGRDYTFLAERWLPQKHCFLLKLNNNFEIVRPPRLAGTKSHAGFDFGLEFLAPLWTGTGSIFLPANVVGGSTAGAFSGHGHAPAEMIYEVMPRKFGGWVKFTNMTEAYRS